MSIAIGELARHARISVETVRFYERIGLLRSPPRTEGGHRAYSSHHLEMLTFIRRARDVGFPIETVRTLLALLQQPNAKCSSVEKMARLQLAELEAEIQQLNAKRRLLEDMVQRCEHRQIEDCGILEALKTPWSDCGSPELSPCCSDAASEQAIKRPNRASCQPTQTISGRSRRASQRVLK